MPSYKIFGCFGSDPSTNSFALRRRSAHCFHFVVIFGRSEYQRQTRTHRIIYQKTGAKLAGKAALKVGAKKIPVLGLAFGAAFATGRAMDGDWTGAGMELSSGAASCFPGAGTATSLAIDGALLARDLKAGR